MVTVATRVLAVLLVVGLMACDRVDDDVIVFAVATPPSVLDPRLASDAASERVNGLLYDRLVVLDERGSPQPAMADWEAVAADRYRVTLRADRASFWNGRRPNAADVAATYASLAAPGLASPHAGALAHVARIETPADDTLEFVLERPDPLFPTRLTLGILPTELAGEGGVARTPLGSGPLAFVAWRADGGVLLERRRDGQRIAVTPVADPTMRVLKLLRGEAHLLQNDLPAELYAHLEGHDGLQLRQRPGTTFAYLGFNFADPVLASRDVRAAIAHAIDRDAIIQHLFGGRADKGGSILRATHWAGVRGLDGFDHDPARARAYLAQAGYSTDRPLQLSFKTSTDPFRLRIAHVLQQQLAAVGIRMQIASYEWGTFFGDIKAGRFQMYSLAWVGVNSPDILRYAFHSDSRPPTGANRGAYRSAQVDALIGAAEAADPSAARALYGAAQRLIHDDIALVPLWHEANVAASRDLAGYVPGHDGNYLALDRVTWRHGH